MGLQLVGPDFTRKLIRSKTTISFKFCRPKEGECGVRAWGDFRFDQIENKYSNKNSKKVLELVLALKFGNFNEKPYFYTKKSILVLFTLPFILSLSLKLKVFKHFSLVFL